MIRNLHGNLHGVLHGVLHDNLHSVLHGSNHNDDLRDDLRDDSGRGEPESVSGTDGGQHHGSEPRHGSCGGQRCGGCSSLYGGDCALHIHLSFYLGLDLLY